VRAGLPEPIIGHTVHHEGYWVGTPDLAYVREKVAIEYQGSGHRQEDVFEEDIDRLERFREAGWTVIQITKRHLGDPRALAERVRRALAAAGARV
jgi:very-short-patch-repair endonuclease